LTWTAPSILSSRGAKISLLMADFALIVEQVRWAHSEFSKKKEKKTWN
jgi:hypothetical protein